LGWRGPPLPPSPSYPRASEATAEALLKRGARASVVRLSQVHDTARQGFVTYAIALARERGVSAYVGDGLNRWAAVHVLDAARLYRLPLERQEAGARYHAVAEEGVLARDIAEAIGRGLQVPVVSKSPEEAAADFGWLGVFVSRDLTGSSVQTQRLLGWRPTGPGLIADLDRADYFGQTADAAR
jgi:nucleoside-diphosphate-sugar epimerase